MNWLLDIFRRLKRARTHEWRRVPPPNWACKRSGRDVW